MSFSAVVVACCGRLARKPTYAYGLCRHTESPTSGSDWVARPSSIMHGQQLYLWAGRRLA